jgi:hypothetical protein
MAVDGESDMAAGDLDRLVALPIDGGALVC